MTAYDQILYINRPLTQTHPMRLAMLGKLHGLQPPPVETARVLDLGASDGANILAMAAGLTRATFTGVELAETPVAAGRRAIGELGFANVRLERMNLLDVTPEFGEFDYIIAHGLYAWTPLEVREKVLEIASRNLAPDGLAFVSYNTLPGGYLRKAMRDAMMDAVGGETDPRIRLELARRALESLARERPDPKERDAAIAKEAGELLRFTDSALLHDYLAPVFEPARFADFAARAACHGLQYVADASIVETWNLRLDPKSIQEAHAIPDRIRREQFLDTLRMRAFRQSILAHRAPLPDWDASRAAGCHAASNVTEVAAGKFTSGSDATMTTRNEQVLRTLRRLTSIWPQSEPVARGDESMAMELYKHGFIDLLPCPSLAGEAGDRPQASALARLQLQAGHPGVSTLFHRWVDVEDETARRFLGLLDGSRSRADLAGCMQCSPSELDLRLRSLERLGLFPSAGNRS